MTLYSEYKKRVDHWREKLPHASSALDKVETILDILAVQRELCPPLSLSGDSTRQHGITAPLYTVTLELINFAALQDVFGALTAKLAPHRTNTPASVLAELTGSYLDATQTGIDTLLNTADAELLSLVHLALKPQMEKTALTVLPGLTQEDRLCNRCPICGALPYASDLRNDNRERFLHCSLCAHQWAYPRVRCVFCDTMDTEQLGYFTVDDNQDIRVDFCKSCGGYLKNFDISQCFSPPAMPVEDTATLHLDYKAIESGFKKATPNYIGFLI
ncbi:MAG: hypothetical protein BWK76_08690 [Desulfobulbaceae bacterium A2]|nr:MAG: hypothetical protein BWK76_08690 [Desulfobulbaceae bacterium A2]